MREDGLWVVQEKKKHFGEDIVFDGKDGPGHGPDMGKGMARVPEHLLNDAIDAAESCPGECIFFTGEEEE